VATDALKREVAAVSEPRAHSSSLIDARPALVVVASGKDDIAADGVRDTEGGAPSRATSATSAGEKCMAHPVVDQVRGGCPAAVRPQKGGASALQPVPPPLRG